MKKEESLPFQEALARQDMYRFLSAVFLSPPQQDLLKRIADTELLQGLSTLLGREAVADLKEFATMANSHQYFESIKQEYMDLFAVPAGRYVFPFEDIYRGIAVNGQQERGPLLGERAIAVAGMYREAGVEIDRTCKELPTHIGVELAFMSFLCEGEALAILEQEETKDIESTRYRDLQVRFLREHLNQWFPQLRQSIQRNAKSQFYRGLALITEAFLAQDTAGLLSRRHSETRILRGKGGKNGSVKYPGHSTQCGTE
ncbi:MAG: molecular chaperone [Deltaproteobacteria bacterium]